ncbi:MAG: hypothetical protein RL745_275, partial [Actinomycetota bacterium]
GQLLGRLPWLAPLFLRAFFLRARLLIRCLLANSAGRYPTGTGPSPVTVVSPEA